MSAYSVTVKTFIVTSCFPASLPYSFTAGVTGLSTSDTHNDSVLLAD